MCAEHEAPEQPEIAVGSDEKNQLLQPEIAVGSDETKVRVLDVSASGALLRGGSCSCMRAGRENVGFWHELY